MGEAALRHLDDIDDIYNEQSALSDLNLEQRAAALSTDRPTLVVSPAGTGKTRVLAARYKLMLARGTPVSRLLAITFSRRAAEEMLDRVGSALQGFDKRHLFIDTFHAIGARILRSMPEEFGLTDKFRVAEIDEIQLLMREACRRNDPDSLEVATLARDRILRLIEALDEIKTEGLTPAAIACNSYRFKGRRFDRREIEILEDFETLMQAEDLVDFNDLILKPLLSFERDPAMARAWSRQFEAVMVDEYQDTNVSQYRLLRHLTQSHSNVLMLGDDDQLIFGWRGADISYVVDFEKQWPGGQVITLTTNYRNAPELLARAKGLIDRNTERRRKEMRSARSSHKATIELRTFDTQKEEQDYIARLIKMQIDRGRSPDKIAVLTRSRIEASTIALSLAATGINCYHPDDDLYNFREVRALLAWSRVALNESDNPALTFAMTEPDCGFTMPAIDYLSDIARERNQPLILTLREAVSSGKAQKNGPLATFLAKIDALKSVNLNSSRAFEYIAKAVGLDIAAEQRSPANHDALLAAFDLFRISFEEVGSMAGVLEAVNVSARAGLTARQGEPRVRVDTMHSTKGLEFDLVIASGWEEGTFPKRNPSPMALEEDRRLAYVTLTRARNMFIATTARQRSKGQLQPSRFLTEIGLCGDLVF